MIKALTAFVVLLNASSSDPSARLLFYGLPFLGLVCCVTVGLAVIAAEREGKPLGNQRALLAAYINNETKSLTPIPKIGSIKSLRDQRWTLFFGALPHRFLPWMFALLWLLLLVF